MREAMVRFRVLFLFLFENDFDFMHLPTHDGSLSVILGAS